MTEQKTTVPEKAGEGQMTGKMIGGGVAAVLGAAIGYILLGPVAILPAAVVVGLLGVALGAVFD